MKNVKSAKMLNKREGFNKYGITVEKKTNYTVYWPLHWHNCWELEIVTEGIGMQTLNGTEYEITPGSVYILNPTDYHEVRCDGMNMYNISFSDETLSDEFISAFSGNGGGRITQLDKESLEQLSGICEMLLYECKGSLKYSDKASQILLDLLFVRLLRHFGISENKKNDSRKALVSSAVSYINVHFRENPSLSDTANHLGITPNYLSEEFHAVTGKKYKEYLNEVRLMYAKKLLASSSLSVTEICFASGFSSLSNFLRVFKAKFGVSPQTMQREL